MRLAGVLVGWLVASSVGAMGFTEDPQEKLTRSWTLEAVKSLEIRGEIDFELIPGDVPRVTVETTRALFDQLTVSNWWGSATVAIESGLRGPRERGQVKATIALPSLAELRVSDRSNGRGVWPSRWGKLNVADKSTLDLVIEGTNFSMETSWLTKVTLGGRVAKLTLSLRHESQVDTTSLEVGEAEAVLDEKSRLTAGPTKAGAGLARHDSKVSVETLDPWKSLITKEDSQVEVRSP